MFREATNILRSINNMLKGYTGGGSGGGGTNPTVPPFGVSSPANGQVLTYDAATGKWTNQDVSGTLDSWVSGTGYSKDDIVDYNGGIYKAKGNIASSTTAPDVDSANWVAVVPPSNLELLPWSATVDYEIGDTVVFNEIVYKARTAHKNVAPNSATGSLNWDHYIGNHFTLAPDNFKEWDVAEAYDTNDIVHKNNVLYVALIDNIGKDPETSTTEWKPFLGTKEHLLTTTDFKQWTRATDYKAEDLVIFNGAGYRAKQNIANTVTDTPAEDVANWELFIGVPLPIYKNLLGDLPGTPIPGAPNEGDYFEIKTNGTYAGVAATEGQKLVYYNTKWVTVSPDSTLIESDDFAFWAPGIAYTKGSLVLYNGLLYNVRADVPLNQNATPDSNPFYEVFIGHQPELAQDYLGEANPATNPTSNGYGDKGQYYIATVNGDYPNFRPPGNGLTGIKAGQWIIWDGHGWKVEKQPDAPILEHNSLEAWTDTTYTQNQLVLHEGVVYKSKVNIASATGVNPKQDPTNWEIYIGQTITNLVEIWRPSTAFVRGTYVVYNDALYRTMLGVPDTITDTPDIDTTNWILIIGSRGALELADTGTELRLDNTLGTFANMASANATQTYTIKAGSVIGGWTLVLINTATAEPTVTGATKVKGATYKAATDMEMLVYNRGNAFEYCFFEI